MAKFKVGDKVRLIDNHTLYPYDEEYCEEMCFDNDGIYQFEEGSEGVVSAEPHWENPDWLNVDMTRCVFGAQESVGIHKDDKRWKLVRRIDGKLDKLKKQLLGGKDGI